MDLESSLRLPGYEERVLIEVLELGSGKFHHVHKDMVVVSNI